MELVSFLDSNVTDFNSMEDFYAASKLEEEEMRRMDPKMRKPRRKTLAFFLKPSEIPTTNGGMQNGSSVGTCTHCMHVLACFAPIGMLSR